MFVVMLQFSFRFIFSMLWFFCLFSSLRKKLSSGFFNLNVFWLLFMFVLLLFLLLLYSSFLSFPLVFPH